MLNSGAEKLPEKAGAPGSDRHDDEGAKKRAKEEGQIAGGVAQGIGYALYEKVVWREGRMQNGQMTNYIMPTSADLPPIRVFFEEIGNIHGAYGAKGIGELPMDGPAPAIVNAIEDALKMHFDFIPLLPEDIFEVAGSR